MTPAKFHRTTFDSPQRSADVFAGPYTRPRFFTLHKWAYGLTLAASILGTLALISGVFKP